MHLDLTALLLKHEVIFNILQEDNEESKLVGGCVRDFLIYGIISEDTDVSTTLSPQAVILKLQKYKHKHNDVNCIILDKDIRYGTIVAIINKRKYEITTTRSDIRCFGRQAEVKFCKDFYIDSQRRDFTINAIYLGDDGKIVDFHGGLNDLQNGIIRFIGKPKKRIEEDYLRIIRFFRFATKFSFFNFEDKVLQDIQEVKTKLAYISRDRIRNEIFKILEYDNWYRGLSIMHEYDLLKNIFLLHKYGINTNNPHFFGNKIVQIFYFFNYDVKCLINFKTTLRFTKNECKFTDFLIHFWQITNNGTIFNLDVKLLIFYSPNLYIMDIIKLFNEKIQQQITAFLSIVKPSPVNSYDILNSGLTGKAIGVKKKELDKIWIKNNFTLTKQELLQYL